MSRSFFTFTNDWELVNASRVFSEKISLSPAVYGLTAAEAAAYSVLHHAFADAYSHAAAPGRKCTSLVIGKNDARAPLVAMASRLAKRIDGVASVTDEQRIDLGLSVRAKRSPQGAPGTPERFGLSLLGNGCVELHWKCKNPRGSTGTMYHVYRQINDEPDYTFLQSVGTKRFTDTTLPEGATNIRYRVQAVRSTAKGEWGNYDVRFGVRGSAGTGATTQENLARAA